MTADEFAKVFCRFVGEAHASGLNRATLRQVRPSESLSGARAGTTRSRTVRDAVIAAPRGIAHTDTAELTRTATCSLEGT